MTREGSCSCGAVRYAIDGPVRDVVVCHCDACCKATGGPWSASAARRQDLTVEDPGALIWERADVSEHGASRGSCRTCRSSLFWDAPGRETISFGVTTLSDASGLEVAGHIWLTAPGSRGVLLGGTPTYTEGLPPAAAIPWRA